MGSELLRDLLVQNKCKIVCPIKFNKVKYYTHSNKLITWCISIYYMLPFLRSILGAWHYQVFVKKPGWKCLAVYKHVLAINHWYTKNMCQIYHKFQQIREIHLMFNITFCASWFHSTLFSMSPNCHLRCIYRTPIYTLQLNV